MVNVLILMVDEMASWGCGPTVHTPNIDALRARGKDFTACYTPSPMCVPARASIATGKYVHEIGCWSSAEAYSGTPKGWTHQLNEAEIDVVSFGKLHYAVAQTIPDSQIKLTRFTSRMGLAGCAD